jgi:uncharacterized membrane protein
MIWIRLSNIGAWSAGVAVILHIFFNQQVKPIMGIIAFVEITGALLYIISEIMKLIIRKKQTKKVNHSMRSRVILIQKVIAIFFVLNFILAVLNTTIFKGFIPFDITAYFFFLSLGIFIGFNVCLNEINKWQQERRNYENERTKLQN